MGWDNFASDLSHNFDSGFEMGRQKKQDRIVADEAAFQRRKTLDFENPQNQAEAMVRDRMLKKEADARELIQAHAANLRAEAGMHGRMPQDRATPQERAEAAVGPKLKYLDEGISSLDSKDDWKLFHPTTWGTGTNLTPEESQLRDSMKSRRMGLLGIGGGASPARPPGAPAARGGISPQQQDLYIRARKQGKSEAEARRIAGG